MISAFRKKLGPAILWSLIGIVSVGLLAYLGWGYFGDGGGGGRRVGGGFVVATVGPEQISYDQFSREYARQMDTYRRMLGEKFDEKLLEALRLKEQVLDRLVVHRVLLQRAKALGLSVTPEEVAAEIRAMPAFGQTGFTKATYLLLLRQNNTTPEEFEAAFAGDLLIRKMEDLVKAGVKVSDPEVRDLFNAERQTLTVDYVELTDQTKAKELADKITVAVSEGKDFKAAAQAAGLAIHTVSVTGTSGSLEGVKEPAALRQAAATLKPGQMSSLVQAPGAAYLLRVVDKKLPSDADFEKERVSFRRLALGQKREVMFQEWVREVRREAKVWVDREALGG
jgi:parvulin-like peptidyl-prolyl isomerase